MSTKQRIAILGSTGSVGSATLNIISKYQNLFKVDLLVCENNNLKISQQANKFSAKYIFINNNESSSKINKKNLNSNVKILRDFAELERIFLKKKKFDKVILCVSSYSGLKYAFSAIKFSKELLIANKESIICGGHIFLKEAKKHNCKITSIDSEHYCLSEILKNEKLSTINSVYLTASGGPFLNKKKKFYNKSLVKDVIKHPKWKMGKKISVDSATMVNKIFEIIEAHVLFNIPLAKIKIKIHKESLIHSAVIFKDGLVKIIMHDTSMIIPIRNCLFNQKFFSQKKNYFSNKPNFSLSFNETLIKKFEIIFFALKIIRLGQRAWILFNIINDKLVEKFFKKEIFFYQITKNLIKIFKNKTVIFYCKTRIKNLSDIYATINYAENFIKNYEVQ